MLSLTASTLTIRMAAGSDWTLLSDMYTDFELQDGDDFPRFKSAESWKGSAGAKRRERWLDDLKSGLNLVAIDGDRVAGHLVMQVTGKLAEISVFVHPDYRRQHVGRSLLKTAMAQARQKSMESVWAVIGTENYPAQQLFHKAGFHKAWEKDGEQQLVFKC